MHVAALGCAWIALDAWALALVVAGVGLSWGAEWHRLRAQTLELKFDASGGLALAGATGLRRLRLQCSALPASWLAVICAADSDGQRETLIITPDRVDADAFRKLRVWLRWHRCTPSGVSD